MVTPFCSWNSPARRFSRLDGGFPIPARIEVMGTEVDTIDQDRVDEIIWRYIDVKSIREIAELTGLKTEQVLSRKKEIIDGVNSLTIEQKRQKLLIELDGMARDARDRAQDTSDEFYAGMVNAATGNIKTMLQELSRMQKADQGKIEALNKLQIKELQRIVEVSALRTFSHIAKNRDLTEEEMEEVFIGHMMSTARQADAE